MLNQMVANISNIVGQQWLLAADDVYACLVPWLTETDIWISGTNIK